MTYADPLRDTPSLVSENYDTPPPHQPRPETLQESKRHCAPDIEGRERLDSGKGLAESSGGCRIELVVAVGREQSSKCSVRPESKLLSQEREPCLFLFAMVQHNKKMRMKTAWAALSALVPLMMRI